MPRKTLYGLHIGDPGSQRREETLGKLESMGWFTAHADWELKSVEGRLVKLSHRRFKEFASDPEFESIPYPSEDMVLLALKIPADEATRGFQRGTDIRISLQ